MRCGVKIINNKKGFSYIFICVITIFVAIVIFTGLQYNLVLYTVKAHKNDVQLKLDSVIMKSAVENYDALKQGEVYGDYIDKEKLVRDAYEALDFSLSTESVHMDGCSMSRPEIEAIEGNGYGIRVSYELTIPFEMLDHTLIDITVPIELYSQYKEK